MQYPDYKPALASPPLSDDELQSLDEQLGALGRDTAMNIEALDGYLTALLLAPEPPAGLRGAQWLPQVWGGDGPGPGDAPFASGKQKKRVLMLVLRHLRDLDQTLHQQPQRWEPVFSVAEDGDHEWVDAEDWCAGFLQATQLDAEGWGRLFDDPGLGPLLTPIGLLGGDEAGLSPADAERLADPAHRDALARAVPDAVLALARRAR